MAARQRRGRSITPNQIAAYNVRRARELRGLSQQAAAARVSPLTGTAWTIQSWSDMETAAAGDPADPKTRIRHLSADDLVGMAVAFDVPVAWLLLPPSPSPDQRADELPDGTKMGRDVFSDDRVTHVAVGEREETSFDLLDRLLRLDDPAFVGRVAHLWRRESDGGLLPDRRADTYGDQFLDLALAHQGPRSLAAREAETAREDAQTLRALADRLDRSAEAMQAYATDDEDTDNRKAKR